MRNRLIKKLVSSVRRGFHKNGGKILLALGICGGVATTVSAVKVTPTAIKRIENRKRELSLSDDEKLSLPEVVKTAGPCYIGPVVTGVTSIACVLGADSINSKRNAALMTAYTMSEAAMREYKDEVIEKFGEEKARKIESGIQKKKLAKDPPTQSNMILTGKGDVLCYDPFSGRYFETTMEQINKAIINLNYRVLSDMYSSLNDLYYDLGIDTTKKGDDLGWGSNYGVIEPNVGTQLSDDGKPCLVLDFNIPPRYDFTDY